MPDPDRLRRPCRQQPAVWVPHSVIDRQAAAALGKLLAADSARSGGASIKSLTLAPHVVEKKATHAVTCNTLKCATAGSRRLPLSRTTVSRCWPGAYCFNKETQ